LVIAETVVAREDTAEARNTGVVGARIAIITGDAVTRASTGAARAAGATSSTSAARAADTVIEDVATGIAAADEAERESDRHQTTDKALCP
jgi:hypothetical protein